MFVKTSSPPSSRCGLCSLEVNDDVLCGSCREMLGRLARIAAPDPEPPIVRQVAVSSATQRKAKQLRFPLCSLKAWSKSIP